MKICPICGEEFEAYRLQQKYCSLYCSIIAKREQSRELYRQKHTVPAKYRDKSSLDRIRAKSKLDETIKKARECGLSYGKYVAQIKFFGKTYEELKLN